MQMQLKQACHTVSRFATLSLLIGCAAVSPVQAAEPVVEPGRILGEVHNPSGVAQMGATIFLYNRYQQLVGQVLSDRNGHFLFDALPADTYSVRVSAASFVPALKRNIQVLAGSQHLLEIHLATLFSSINLVPSSRTRSLLMSDDWKWVLRSSAATRPVLRLRPNVSSSKSTSHASWFEDTSSMLQLSAGDSNQVNSGMQQDLGTAFAVEATVSGNAQVRLSGNLGYGAAASLPSSSFRTTYSKKRGALPGPETSLTVRQIYFPVQGNAGATGGSAPVLRAATLSSIDQIDILDGLNFEYGFAMDTIMMLGRLSYLSPFARATYDLEVMGAQGTVRVAFSSGTQPTELLIRTGDPEPGLKQDLIALQQAPLIARRSDHATMERRKNYEAAYEFQEGSRTYTAMIYREQTSDAVFLMSGNFDAIDAANLLPDLSSRGTVFNLGNYERTGFSLSATQQFAELAEFSIAAGRGGALVFDGTTLTGFDESNQIRNAVDTAQRNWVTLQAESAVPMTGTHLNASYGWTDFRALTPVHVSLTGAPNQQIGWTVGARQPVPGFGGMRMELSAELRNMLAQGYLRITASDGSVILLTNSPRAVRGGLSFIF